MSVASHVFSGLETAPKNRMDSDGIEIVRRYDAANGALGAVTDAEGGSHDFVHNKCVKHRAAPLQIEQIRPRKSSSASFAARRSSESEQLLMVGYRRVGTE